MEVLTVSAARRSLGRQLVRVAQGERIAIASGDQLFELKQLRPRPKVRHRPASRRLGDLAIPMVQGLPQDASTSKAWLRKQLSRDRENYR